MGGGPGEEGAARAAGAQAARRAPALAPAELAARVLDGDRKALARAMTWVENEAPQAAALLDALHPHAGRAQRIGITGPPGAGKSTLTAALAARLRESSRTVGIVCVDPTSPFSGGALLGDRIRMAGLSSDPGVFIRSMATRGSLGGIARTTGEVCEVLDAGGRDVVLVETVGVGQSEVEIAEAADTTVVVLSPEAGDGIQAMKAGLMEVADVFVVNKADREGADRLARAIGAMMELSAPREQAWQPPVLKTDARKGTGVAELADALGRHRAHLEAAGLLEAKRRARVQAQVRALLVDRLWALFEERTPGVDPLGAWTGRVLAGETTPHRAAAALVEAFVERLRERTA